MLSFKFNTSFHISVRSISEKKKHEKRTTTSNNNNKLLLVLVFVCFNKLLLLLKRSFDTDLSNFDLQLNITQTIKINYYNKTFNIFQNRKVYQIDYKL